MFYVVFFSYLLPSTHSLSLRFSKHEVGRVRKTKSRRVQGMGYWKSNRVAVTVQIFKSKRKKGIKEERKEGRSFSEIKKYQKSI